MEMKTFIKLLFFIILTFSVICEEYQHSKHKLKHEYHHKEKHSNSHIEKHFPIHHNSHIKKHFPIHHSEKRFNSSNKNHKKHHEQIHNKHFASKFNKRASLSVTVTLDNNSQIRGTVNQTNTDKATRYYLFQGIPYAKPPVGDLRFEPPQEYKLEGFYSATYARNSCTQVLSTGIIGAEDCLYLNVYSTNLSNSSQLPVLVWIHGGTFLNGDGNYETNPPDNFVDQNLIVVTINYRLGVFGYMSTGDDVVPGNMGLKDQALALKWVQEHIVYFGGNPKNVTIMGESAGAASVAYLVQSPKVKGLFHQAIAHSGNTLCPWVLSRKAERNFQLLASELLIFGANKTETVRRMKSVNVVLLCTLSYVSMGLILLEDPLNGYVYAPLIEVPNPTEIFSYKSYEQLDSGNFTYVPMIIGYNSEEGGGSNEAIGLLNIYFLRYAVSPNGLVPLDMNVNDTQTRDKIGKEIEKTYAGNGTLALNHNATVNYITHDFIVRPSIKYVELYSKWESKIYLYRFSYSGNSSQGVQHAEELQYFFYNTHLNADQKLVSSKVVTLWSTFIKTGNPTPPNKFNITWIPSSQSNNYSYLDIGEEFIVYNQNANPDKSYLDKWEYWYSTYGKRPYDTY